ncbi:MAG: c-type cytochrome [Lutibacter sp.]
MRTIKLLVASLILAITFTSCTNSDAPSPVDPNPGGQGGSNAQASYDKADGIRGARLYDHALNEKGITDAVMTDHSNFFRCKTCHGWDLLGPNGVNVSSVGSDTKPAPANVDLMEVRANDDIQEIFDNIKNMTNGRETGTWDASQKDVMPKYGQILSDDDIWDLVKFIKETAHDVSDFYDMDISSGKAVFSNIGSPSKGGITSGDPVAGLATYNSKCASCHNNDGTGINIYCKGEYLGDMFREDPHEIQHKAIWGMPYDREHVLGGCNVPFGGSMPSIDITDQDIRDLMAMGQDATKFPGYAESQAQIAYDNADGTLGARLFDHPLNEKGITDAVMTDHSNFFRCKTCHGWDLLGPNGVNVSSVGSDTKPAPANVDLMEVRANDDILEIFNNIKHMDSGRETGTWDPAKKDEMPKFGQILSDDDIWNLVKFIKETAHDVYDFYDMDISSGSAVFSNIGTPSKAGVTPGDASNGLATYNAKCSGCHGSDGTNIDIYCKGEWLGDMFRNDPHEIQHKAPWGMPYDREHILGGCDVPFGGSMPVIDITDQDIRDMMVMGQDATAFPGH